MVMHRFLTIKMKPNRAKQYSNTNAVWEKLMTCFLSQHGDISMITTTVKLSDYRFTAKAGTFLQPRSQRIFSL